MTINVRYYTISKLSYCLPVFRLVKCWYVY